MLRVLTPHDAYSLDVLEDTQSIEFHTAKLNLGQVKLHADALKEPFVQKASDLVLNEADERATLKLPVTLPAGSKAQLKIDFEGELTGAMMGYYRSAWEHEGKTAHYSLTQFEVCLLLYHFRCLGLSKLPVAHCCQTRFPMLG